MGGRTFDCLDAVINRYKTEQIVEGHTLGHHVSKVRKTFRKQKSIRMAPELLLLMKIERLMKVKLT